MPSALGADDVSFSRDVVPVLLKRCAGCHGDKRAEGAFRVHTFDFLNKGGESGEQAVVPGKPSSSELYRRMIETDAELRMPQEDDALAAADIQTIKSWIEQGASFDGQDRGAPLNSQLAARRHPAAPKIYRTPIPVQSLCFSPDGKQLAMGGYHEVLIWDVESAAIDRRIGSLPQRIQTILWIENSMVVAGGTPGEYGEVVVFDQLDDPQARSLVRFSDIVTDVAVDSNRQRVAACSASRTTKLVRLPNAKLLWRKSIHSSSATGIAFSGDDRFVVTTSLDETVKVVETETGSLFTTFNGHRQQLGDFPGRFKIYDVSYHAGSNLFLTAGEGRAIRIWDPIKAKSENGTAADMEKRFYKKPHTKYVVHTLDKPVFQVVADDATIIAGGANGIIKTFDAVSHKPLREFSGHDDWVYSLAISDDGNQIAAGAHNGRVLIWNLKSGALTADILAAPKATIK